MSTPKNTPWWPLMPFRGHNDYLTVNNFFSKADIETLTRMVETSYDLEEAVAGYNKGADTSEVRHCQVAWLGLSEISAWLYQKITPAIMESNYKAFQYNLRSLETLQYTVYQSGENDTGDFYSKHIDSGVMTPIGTDRKLSFIIQLDDPSNYAGGDVILYPQNREIKVSKNQGDITFFHSSTVHEVTPVTSGTRRSLVGWVHGPI